MKCFMSSLVFITLVLTGCGEEKQQAKEEVKVEKEVRNTNAKKEKDNMQKMAVEVSNSSKKIMTTISSASKEIVAEVSKTSKEIGKISEDIVSKTKKSLNKQTNTVIKKASSVSTEIKSKLNNIINSKQIKEDKILKAKFLYATCISCHGQNGEKKALGKSNVIKGLKKDVILHALKGYKNGTYGGVMKGIMTAQVSSKSNKELEILSEYISKF